MSSSELAISVRGLSKAYKIGQKAEPYSTLADTIRKRLQNPFAKTETETFWALKDVSFDITKGEVVGVIGRNGAGKSTLLKVLSRITEPTHGEIDLYGRVGSLLEVGTGFHQELTGRENIYLNGAILGMTRPQIRSQFDAIVDFAGVGKFLDTPAKRYSTGMFVRLAFAVAAHLEPEILIVDEVLAVGDMEFQKKCMGKMGDVARSGRTVLFVSHNMAAIKKLCQKGLLMKAGQLAFAGDIDQCVTQYTELVGKGGARIVDHTTKRNPAVTVDSVDINGSESDEFHLPSNMRNITISMAGTIHVSIKASLQIRLLDNEGTPIGIFSPGFESGAASSLSPGSFKLTHTVALPRLNRGDYALTFELVSPNILAWFEAANAVSLRAEGTPMATGQTFFAQQEGWLLLDELSADE
jgi:lipopolysaccharide transport system ATP-binding protein